MIEATFRPIDRWPNELDEPIRSQFDTSWMKILRLLERELEQLDANQIIIQIALRESQIRIDGWPKATAKPTHPGVILAFESKHGPLKYMTAKFDRWEDNLYAIARGLESLRRVDRYGITKRGEQYTGWKELPAGGDTGKTQIEWGQELVLEHRGIKAAIQATHPDHGGDPEELQAVLAYRDAQS